MKPSTKRTLLHDLDEVMVTAATIRQLREEHPTLPLSSLDGDLEILLDQLQRFWGTIAMAEMRMVRDESSPF